MKADQLLRQRVQRVEPGCAVPAGLVLWGIHGGSDFVVGLAIGATVIERLPPNPFSGAPREDVDALRVRALREVPPDALRDSKGSAVGYYLYAGLPPDHCRAVAEREGSL
jgi:hypothetical protein